MGSVRCRPCNKRLYTFVQARYALLRRLQREDVHMDMYLCRETDGTHYHLTDIDKKMKAVSSHRFRSELAKKKDNLDQAVKSASYRSSHEHRAVADGAEGRRGILVGVFAGHTYPKALRRKIIRALVIPVSGLHKPRAHLLRRRFKPRKRYHRRWEPRKDSPRGEVMTRMMSWANGASYDLRDQHPRYRVGEQMRRRVRAREAEAVRKEEELELSALAPLQGPEEWHQHRCSTNMAALGTVDFDGCYTSSTE